MSARTVGWLDLARGALYGAPRVGALTQGAWRLATMRPSHRGGIAAVFERWARKTPEHVAVRFEGRDITYRELNEQANRYAAVLQTQGVQPGDVVGVLFDNRPELLAAALAVIKLGATAGMMNPQQPGPAFARSLQALQPTLVFAGAEHVEQVRALSLPVVMQHERGGRTEGYLDVDEAAAQASPENPEGSAEQRLSATAFLILTSGTTGMPKAARMSHYRWLRCLSGVGLMSARLRQDDVLYCALPMFHNNALTVSWSAVLACGATLAIARRFSASGFWRDLKANGATAFTYIGELCRYLLQQPAGPGDRDHQVRVVIGNGLRPELWDVFKQRFGIEHVAEFYGASECNLLFTNGFNAPRTAGFTPLSYAVVKLDHATQEPLRNAKGRLCKAKRGEEGLLLAEVTSRAPFDGYTDQRSSEAKLLRDAFSPGDCWFDTGDLVREQGFRHVAFVDRLGDTFRWKGENVATAEVEAALLEVPFIEHATVYGVTVPGYDGRAGMAALTLKGGLDGEVLLSLLQARLPEYAIPLFLRIREALETTDTFKFRKVELRDEGINPMRVHEPLLVRQGGTYVPLDADRAADITEGRVRL
jgi:fatty-acyl-CoA synthase